MENRLFNTGVCEEKHSKRVVVNALTGVKDFLGLPVYAVKGGSVERYAFDGAITVGGCLCLAGAEVRGVPLYDACGPPVSGFSAVTFDSFRSLFRSFLESAALLRDKTGSLSRMYPNGVYFDAESGAFTFLPLNLSEFLAEYLPDEKKKEVFFVAGGRENRGPARGRVTIPPEDLSRGESLFTESCVRYIYFYFAGGVRSTNSPVYFLADRMSGFPRPLADRVWDTMHGKSAGLEPLLRTLELPPPESTAGSVVAASSKVPFTKRKGYLDLRHGIGVLLTSRWRLFLIIILICGIMVYVLHDLAGKKSATNIPAAQSPEGVVEMYYTALNRLDLDVLQSLFFRRAGREVMNEVSTLYVMSKLGQVYDGRYRAVDGGEPPNVLSIEDLRIEQVSDGDKPVFRAHYKKVINTGVEKTELMIDEIVSIGKVKNRWYILSAESKIVE